jgi:zona occludens toxin
MIEYTLGVPGSGKSYRGIYALYANFGLNEKLKDSKFVHNDVKFAYTNINEIKLDKFQKGSIKSLDWDLFYDSLTTLHAFYKDKLTDTELILKAKELDLFECLIILDECHNYLDKNDVVLIWWLSYHRHFHHQIYLITQNLALVYSKYKSFSEFFYQAKPSSLKLFSSTMVYNQFTSSRLSQVSKSGVVKIPFKKEIFDTYHSGANQQSQNLIKKFVVMAILLFSFLLFFLFFIKSYWTKSSEEPKIIDSKIVNQAIQNYDLPIQNIQPIEEPLQEELKLYKFSCFNTFCYYILEDKSIFEIPQNILNPYLQDIKNDKKYIEIKNNRLIIYVLAAQSKFNFIKGVQNDTTNKTFSDVLSIGN